MDIQASWREIMVFALIYTFGAYLKEYHICWLGESINLKKLDLWGEGKENLFSLICTLLFFLTKAPSF